MTRSSLFVALTFTLVATSATAATGPRRRGQEDLRLGRATIAAIDAMRATGKPESREIWVSHEAGFGKLSVDGAKATFAVDGMKIHFMPTELSAKDQARRVGSSVRRLAPGMTAGQMRDLVPGWRAAAKARHR